MIFECEGNFEKSSKLGMVEPDFTVWKNPNFVILKKLYKTQTQNKNGSATPLDKWRSPL